ncbi:MAG: hypothetical protein A2X94_06645 [Bdellovibrionales bacterium GWB1_55_8]|nr:MAG: hypothetical protein A2X94_06645 [Bdellovibrionales bacterium GWB1_55_8]
MKRLVLFDIDGTILNGGKLWRECFEAAFTEIFPEDEICHVAFSGKTDRQICREMLPSWVSQHESELKIEQVLSGYLNRTRDAIADGRTAEVSLLPGVRELIEELTIQKQIRLGLLTGNVREGARIKLAAVQLDSFFASGVGAFGDDHWDRYRLPEIAVRRVQQEYGESYSGKQVVIIGDTVHDVNCGKSINVRSIAVGTGRAEHLQEILEARPDFFFPTLSEKNTVLNAILQRL